MIEMKPKVRFVGFEDEWAQEKFSETFTSIANNSLSRAELNYHSGLAKNIHYGDILIKFGEVLNLKKEEVPYISDDSLSNKFILSKLNDGDIIIADTAEDESAGKCTELVNIGDEIVVSGLHTIPCRPTFSFASGYLGYFMNSSAYHTQLLRLMQGTKVTSISKSALQDTKILYPTDIREQVKIGNYFTRLDDTITTHQRELTKLAQFKQAMLQKMFPKEGQTIPEVRFEGFESEWDNCTLGDIADIVGGGTPSTTNPVYWNGSIDWYSPVEIGNKAFVEGSQQKITDLGLERSSAKVLPVGTVLFTSRAGIGKTAILSKKGATNQGFQSIIPHKDKLDSYFIYSWTNELKRYGNKNGAGSTFIEISGKQMEKMPILIPRLKEQRVIGEYFKKFDQNITAKQKELTKLKQIKHALFNKMFV